jgi:hypothetical protein
MSPTEAQLQEVNERQGEALASIRANHPLHTNSDICPICLALLWGEGKHPFQGDHSPGRGIG